MTRHSRWGVTLLIAILLIVAGVVLAPARQPVVAEVQNTPFFTIVYGDVLVGGSDAPVGTTITATSPRGDLVGEFVVTISGSYGAMYLYGEDNTVSPTVPGMRDGEVVAFFIDGVPATSVPMLIWHNDKDLHEVDLSAEAPAPTPSPTTTATSAPIPTAVYEATLPEGWNLLSCPLQPVDGQGAATDDLTVILSSVEGSYDSVHRYDAGDAADPEKVYDPADPGGSDLDGLPLGYGFWVHMTVADTWRLVGIEITNPPAIQLYAGPNLIGWPSQTAQALPGALGNAGSYAVDVFAYDRSGPEPAWLSYGPDAPTYANDLAELEPGYGYWLDLELGCVWNGP